MSLLFRPITSTLLLVLLSAPTLPASAQSTGPTSVTVGSGDALQIGGLVQADGTFGGPTGDGFRARSARLRLGGEIQTITYAVQTDFTAPSVLLDAYVQIPLAERLRLRGGLFKTPYSAELLRPRPRLRMAERARVVNALAPARQAGLQLSGDLTGPDSDAQVTATVGAFNGTRGLTRNDNDHLLYLGRLQGGLPLGPGTLTLGAGAGYSVDESVQIPLTDALFAGTRTLVQADAEYNTDWFLLAGEVHTATLDPDPAALPNQSPFGVSLTAGATPADRHQVRVRFDHYDPDRPGVDAPGDRIVLGYNYDLNAVVRVLLNYEAPTGDLTDGAVTGRLQAAF